MDESIYLASTIKCISSLQFLLTGLFVHWKMMNSITFCDFFSFLNVSFCNKDNLRRKNENVSICRPNFHLTIYISYLLFQFLSRLLPVFPDLFSRYLVYMSGWRKELLGTLQHQYRVVESSFLLLMHHQPIFIQKIFVASQIFQFLWSENYLKLSHVWLDICLNVQW